jgi:hypothetical protein
LEDVFPLLDQEMDNRSMVSRQSGRDLPFFLKSIQDGAFHANTVEFFGDSTAGPGLRSKKFRFISSLGAVSRIAETYNRSVCLSSSITSN